MGDDNMDLCECVWGHELAMRRLLNIIRGSQAVCTDTECFEEGFQRPDPASSLLMMTLLMVAAMFLYYYRPRSQRIDGPTKPGGNERDGGPPSPPSDVL